MQYAICKQENRDYIITQSALFAPSLLPGVVVILESLQRGGVFRTNTTTYAMSDIQIYLLEFDSNKDEALRIAATTANSIFSLHTMSCSSLTTVIQSSRRDNSS